MSVQPRRVRLKPWLLAQVNSGRYSGLQWLSSDQRLFQIPWKHATRHTPTSEEETTVFKAWAVETGKYQEGVDDPDPAKWKANLRCALNKSREFQLKYDGTKEMPVRPFKIYEVCEQLANADTGGEDGGEDSSEDAMPNLMDLSIQPRISDSPSFGAFPTHTDVNRFSLAIPVPLHAVNSDLPQQGFAVQGGFGPSGPFPDLDPLPPPAAPMETSTMSGVQNQAAAMAQNDLLHSIPLTDLDLKFQYRGKTVGSLTVSNPLGCRLYYGHLEPTPEKVDLLGPVNLEQVRFPGTSEIQNQKQRDYTEALLDVMDRGLILEILEQNIYAIRLCQCKVFWSGPGVPEQGPPNPLRRERRIKVFDLNDFLQGLILFQKGEAATPPPFELCFCFGEDWPSEKPKEKKLIIVQVVPVVARILTEMFSGELNWSTDSIRLQISNPDVKDQTVEQFKELQRLLQSQHIQGPWTLNMS
ncbi:interferon regulatory factor 5 [Aulostomus maculatus]